MAIRRRPDWKIVTSLGAHKENSMENKIEPLEEKLASNLLSLNMAMERGQKEIERWEVKNDKKLSQEAKDNILEIATRNEREKWFKANYELWLAKRNGG
jgi:ribosome-binding ATPase YchF (GTP1/OBG family)